MQPSEKNNEKVTQGRFKPFIENALYVLGAVLLAFLIQTFVVRPFIVNGISMDPTFKHRDYVLIDQMKYKKNEPQRGDVIVFRAPPEPEKFYIKRVIGLPNETVEINGTQITIKNTMHPNGLKLSEPFIAHPQENNLSIKVPEGEYFVMGDNRSGSYDSRIWGTLPKEEIRGRAWFRLFPFNSIDYLPGKVSYE